MATFFLIIIYIAFMTPGLPNSLLGSSWTVMGADFGAAVGAAGIINMVITCGTIISSLISGWLMRRFGTGGITVASVAAIAAALMGFSVAPGFYWLVLMAIPLGLGAGVVDTVLNNYVALHYKSHHMSWLHCCWGVGAFVGPLIMAPFIAAGSNWRGGYRAIGWIEVAIAVLVLVTLPLWKKMNQTPQKTTTEDLPPAGREDTGSLWSVRGLKPALLAFFIYCGAENVVGLWGASFLTYQRDFTAADAARGVSLFYMGITLGRFLAGFITMRMSSQTLIRIGQGLVLAGSVALLVPVPWVALAGIIMVGLGCAPIFPCMIHQTPHRFGAALSQKIMGIQVAAAYLGSTIIAPGIGAVASQLGFSIFPPAMILLAAGLLLLSERAVAATKSPQPEQA